MVWRFASGIRTTFVDSSEGVVTTLLDLTVDDVVRSRDVGIAGIAETRRVDLVGNSLASKPIAVVVGILQTIESASASVRKVWRALDLRTPAN